MIRMPFHSKASLALGIIAALGAAGSAHAQSTYSTAIVAASQVLNYTVTTNGSSPTFNRPVAGTPPTALSGVGTAVAYATDANPLDANTTSFIAPAAGVYQISTTDTGYASGNFEQFLYGGAPAPFLAASPLTNVKYGISATGHTTTFNYNVAAGNTYQLVNAGYFNASDTAPADLSLGTSTTTVTNLGSVTAIPDASRTNGALAGTPATQSLTVTDTTTITSFDGITIVGLNHTSLGDLTATLSHGGVTVDLFDHTGAANNTFQGDPGSGAQFSSANTYTFAQNGANLSAVSYGATAPSGTYKATTNAAGGYDKLDLNNTLASFVGQSVAGVWTISFTDHQADDTGSFTGFKFTINSPAAAPEPSQFAALGVGLLGLGALALRARRKSQAA